MASSNTPSTSNAAPSNNIIIQDNTLTNSTVHMHQHVNQSTSGEPPQSYGLPSVPTIVDKREADIRELHALMSKHHKIVITGLAGFGKTTLANLCARKWVEDGTYQHVLFINVETDESASGVFKRLAEIVLNSQVYSESTIEEIYSRYNEKKTLLILDNIEQNSLLSKYNPLKELTNIDILGTSQFTELERLFHLYPLQVLRKGASVQLVLDIFKSNNIKEHSTVDIVPVIYDLVDKLEFHPLALQHAAAHIIDMYYYDKVSLEQCLNKYMEHFETQLKQEFPTDQPSKYRNSASVYAAISLNIKKATIEKEHVQSLLHCMTYLDPSHIDIQIFYKAFSTDHIQEVLRQLNRFSLISVDGDMVCMHRLVSVVCHAMLTADDKITYLKSLLNIFFHNTDRNFYFQFIGTCSFFIDHFEMYFKINKEELAAYYKAAFHNNQQIKERLTARLQMINCVISDTEGWSVEQCCVFAGHGTFYRYFTGVGKYDNHYTITTQFIFVPVIRYSSFYLFGNFIWSILKFYKDNKEELNKPIFKNLTILSMCAAFGIDDDDFISLIDMGCDVNITDNNGMTPILWAAKNMSYEKVFIILRRGATCDVRYKEVLTAAAAGDGESVLRLLRTSEVCYATGEYGKTLLWWAADKGHHDIVRELIEHGTDTNGADARGNTLLHMVACGGYDGTVSQFICSAGDVNNANSNGDTALILAASRGYDKIVSKLIGAKVDLNIANSKGKTALMLATDRGHDKIVSQLICAEADLNITDNVCCTALMWSAIWGLDEITTKLAQAGANVNITDNRGETPLYCAAKRGRREVVTELVNRGAHVDTANKLSTTPLLAAAEYKHREISMYLIEKGASVNAVDDDGDTPLYWAAVHGYSELVTELVNRGAHVDTANKHGYTPLLVATVFQHREISLYLIEKGANVNAVDGDGDTPLLFAAEHGDYELALELINRGARTDPPANNRGDTPLTWAQWNKDDRMEHIISGKRRRQNVVQTRRSSKGPVSF